VLLVLLSSLLISSSWGLSYKPILDKEKSMDTWDNTSRLLSDSEKLAIMLIILSLY
jgi:hypothetical protein